MDSILTSIKKMLGITEEYEHFDQALIIHINTVLNTLTQIGVGPEQGFAIDSSTQTWSDFLYGDSRLDLIKSYVYLKVKMLFDPPWTDAGKPPAQLSWMDGRGTFCRGKNADRVFDRKNDRIGTDGDCFYQSDAKMLGECSNFVSG